MTRYLLLFALFTVLLSGCGPAPASPQDRNAQATAIIKSAKATNTALARLAKSRPTDTPVPTLTPRPKKTPEADAIKLPPRYGLFTSDLNPYSIGYPSGWAVRGDAFRIGDISGDIFVETGQGGAVSVNVVSEPVPAGAAFNAEDYLDLTLRQLGQSKGVAVKRSGKITVGYGRKALLITYTRKSGLEGTNRITQAIWVASGRGWAVTLSTPPHRHARYLPVLKAMLKTFQEGPVEPARGGSVN